jgi:membrane-bound lytic murein transglycosylase D
MHFSNIFLLIQLFSLNIYSQFDSIGYSINDSIKQFEQIDLNKTILQDKSSITVKNNSDSTYINRLTALPFQFEMTYNKTVKQYIELYASKIKNKTQAMMGLGQYYFPIFESILSSYGLPPELKYIPIIESGLNQRAVSPAHARGLWQFVRSTGIENGLIINKLVDQRYSVFESTNAAAKHLKYLYETYGNWQLALAAYNCGSGNVNRAIRRSGGKRSFWEIYRYLPRETRSYVPAFIGAAYAFSYGYELGIFPDSIKITQTDTVLILKSLHFKQISQVLGIPVNILRKLNPQYLKDVIPASESKLFSLHLPAEQKLKFLEYKDSIYTYPIEFTPYITSVSLNELNTVKLSHLIRKGETLSAIAEKYGVSVSSIKKWNNISSNRINQGHRLVIYARRARGNY